MYAMSQHVLVLVNGQVHVKAMATRDMATLAAAPAWAPSGAGTSWWIELISSPARRRQARAAGAPLAVFIT